MSFRLSLCLLGLSLTLTACDRAAEEKAQQPGDQASENKVLTGVIDRRFAGDLMPAMNVIDPAGNELNLGALQGQPVLINLWATWCAPCVIEMPMLDNLADELGDELRVLTISQDSKGAEKVVPFFAKHQFRNLEPWMDPQNALDFGAGSAGLPLVVLYDASGREVFRVAGGYEWDNREAIAQIREGLDPDGR